MTTASHTMVLNNSWLAEDNISFLTIYLFSTWKWLLFHSECFRYVAEDAYWYSILEERLQKANNAHLYKFLDQFKKNYNQSSLIKLDCNILAVKIFLLHLV